MTPLILILILSLLSILCFALAYWVQGEELRDYKDSYQKAIDGWKKSNDALIQANNLSCVLLSEKLNNIPPRDKRGRFISKEV